MPEKIIWCCGDDDRRRLALLGFDEMASFLNPPGGEVVSEVRDRIVYHIGDGHRKGSPGYYLKIFRNPGANQPVSQVLRFRRPVSCAAVEEQRLRWLENAGFRAPRVVVWGDAMSGWRETHSFLMTCELEGLGAADVRLEEAHHRLLKQDYRQRKRILVESLALLLRRLHEAGFDHPFPYLRHFFVPDLVTSEPLPEPGEFHRQVAVIDVHSARIGWTVSKRRRARGLAELFLSSLRSPLTHSDRLRFLRVYSGDTPDRDLVSRILKRFNQKLRRHPNRYAWACERMRTMAFPRMRETYLRTLSQ